METLSDMKNCLNIIAIDDYQNKIISEKDCKISIDGNYVKLTSVIFQHQDMELDPEEDEQAGGRVCIRLQPASNYPLDEKVRVLWGQTTPGSEIHFVFINHEERYCLTEDYQTGEKKIHINCHDAAFMDGTLWSLQTSDGRIEEFWLEKPLTYGIYSLKYKLTHSYESGKCLLRRVYPVIADTTGHFFLPVPQDEENCTEYRYYMPLNKTEIYAGTFRNKKTDEAVEVMQGK